MSKNYNQFRAMMAVTVASLRSTFKSPQSIFFSLFFPIMLIVIFGALGKGGGGASADINLDKTSDTTNLFYEKMRHSPLIHFTHPADPEDELRKGRITAIVHISKTNSGAYDINVRTSTASKKNLPLLLSALNGLDINSNKLIRAEDTSTATISYAETPGGRVYKMIDFFLPGMIGFSLIGSAVFSVAFLLFSLRETLVLKRLYSTPIKKKFIILGESFARVIFQLLTVVVLIVFGAFFYGFTLAHGWYTFFDMLILSVLALLVFMGFGFFISSIAKNQHVIPIYANLFMFPQYFLSGTFFPKEALPEFLQPIIKYLPLTALNDGMRNVAFEGASLASCWQEMLILAVWGIAIYAITIRVFRWE
jgi:ABC-2 type transport system permease protein